MSACDGFRCSVGDRCRGLFKKWCWGSICKTENNTLLVVYDEDGYREETTPDLLAQCHRKSFQCQHCKEVRSTIRSTTPSGVANTGQSCFFGSLLQGLSALGLTASCISERDCDPLLRGLSEGLELLHQNVPCTPRVAHPFDHGQHDVHEVFLEMLSRSETLRTLFKVRSLSTVRCHRCNLEFVTADLCYGVELGFKHAVGVPSIVKLVEWYCEPDQLSGQEAFFCTTCGVLTNATRVLQCSPLAVHFNVVLKIFDGHGVKIHRPVLVSEFLTFGGQVYRLVATIVHIGRTLQSGHYVCYMKRRGQWWRADDAQVTAASLTTLSEGRLRGETPYMLLYSGAQSEPAAFRPPEQRTEPVPVNLQTVQSRLKVQSEDSDKEDWRNKRTKLHSEIRASSKNERRPKSAQTKVRKTSKSRQILRPFPVPASRVCDDCGALMLTSEPCSLCCNSGSCVLSNIFWRPIDHELCELLQQKLFSELSQRVNMHCALGVLQVRGKGLAHSTPPCYYALYGRTYQTSKPLSWFIRDIRNTNSQETPQFSSILDAWRKLLVKRNKLLQTIAFSSFDVVQGVKMKIRREPPKQDEVALVCSTFEVERGCIYFAKGPDEGLHYVSNKNALYETLMYPVFFEDGHSGWSTDCSINLPEYVKRTLYQSVRHRFAGVLKQIWVLDMFSRWEELRIQYMENNTKVTRSMERRRSVSKKEFSNRTPTQRLLGRLSVLPPSIMGSPLYQRKLIDDGMAVIAKFGTPTYFITMTANAAWPEIGALTATDAKNHPDFVTRCFHRRHLDFMAILRKGLFDESPPLYYQSVVEFQKRGLPHCHVIFRTAGSQPIHALQIDTVVSTAWSALSKEQPDLYALVQKYMIHTCKVGRCKKDEFSHCEKGFPKDCSDCTFINDKGFAVYKRAAEDGFVVPYNPHLLKRYECHINIEVSSGSRVAKYLRKYMTKAPDSLDVALEESYESISEFELFQRLRYVSVSEAVYRMLDYDINQFHPTAKAYGVHLPGEQRAILEQADDGGALDEHFNSDTAFLSPLLAYFGRPQNVVGDKFDFDSMKFKDFFETFDVIKVDSKRKLRDTGYVFTDPKLGCTFQERRFHIVVRLYRIYPTQTELFALKLLVLHKAARSFEDLRCVGGVELTTFFEAARVSGLIDDNEYNSALKEYIESGATPAEVRFFCALLCLQGAEAKHLFFTFVESMFFDLCEHAESLPLRSSVINKVLKELNNLFELEGKQLSDFGLSYVGTEEDFPTDDVVEKYRNSFITLQEKSSFESSYVKLNADQKKVVDTVIQSVERPEPRFIFVDAPAGTGKTFSLNCLCAAIRATRKIVIASAYTGVAAGAFSGGLTCHKAFGLAFDMENNYRASSLTAQHSQAKIIQAAPVIIVDEVSMLHKLHLVEIDRLLSELNHTSKPFGGKVVVLCGDFRQIPPVIEDGGEEGTISACCKNATIWRTFERFELRTVMRQQNDVEWIKILLEIGDGYHKTVDVCQLGLGEVFTVPEEARAWLTARAKYLNTSNYAIIAPLNSLVDEHNEAFLKLTPGDEVCLPAAEKADEDCYDSELLTTEYMSAYRSASIPDHLLRLKSGCTVHIVRNLSQHKELLNGTKLVFISAMRFTMKLHFLGQPANVVTLPRIRFQVNDEGVKFTRTQFPIKLSFATTINKAQGKTLDVALLDFRASLFSHGQLYVSLSRTCFRRNIGAIIPLDSSGKPQSIVNNVVFHALLV